MEKNEKKSKIAVIQGNLEYGIHRTDCKFFVEQDDNEYLTMYFDTLAEAIEEFERQKREDGCEDECEICPFCLRDVKVKNSEVKA